MKKAKQRRRINPISNRRKRLSEIYRREVRAWLALPENQKCRVMRGEWATQCHHIRGRLGTLLLDKRFWLPVSQSGHFRIHSHPAWAQVNGWIAELGKWNTPPRDAESERLKEVMRAALV